MAIGQEVQKQADGMSKIKATFHFEAPGSRAQHAGTSELL